MKKEMKSRLVIWLLRWAGYKPAFELRSHNPTRTKAARGRLKETYKTGEAAAKGLKNFYVAPGHRNILELVCYIGKTRIKQKAAPTAKPVKPPAYLLQKAEAPSDIIFIDEVTPELPAKVWQAPDHECDQSGPLEAVDGVYSATCSICKKGEADATPDDPMFDEVGDSPEHDLPIATSDQSTDNRYRKAGE